MENENRQLIENLKSALSKLELQQDKLKENQERLSTKQSELKEKIQKLEASDRDFHWLLEIIKNNIEATANDTKEVKETLTKIMEQRTHDHLIEPLSRAERLKDKVIYTGLGIFVTWAIMEIFPILTK